ncbi:MAG: hypothetical protein WD314_04935 [Trueperaceae bacterium]
MKDLLVNGVLKRSLNRHRPGRDPNVFLFGTPRGGTTWLMEMIWSQPGFKSCNEPLDLRNPLVRKHLGISEWRRLYDRTVDRQLESYLGRLERGELYIVDPLPGRGRYHRFFSHRTVFKIIHGAEDRIEFLANRFHGRALLLVRHPIPVSLSRQTLPRLEAMVEGDYRRHFTADELVAARRVIERGLPLEKAVLDWCLQTAVPLRQLRRDWLVVSYEQLVLEPEAVIPVLARELGLPSPERMMRHVALASQSSNQSDAEARRLLGMAGRQEASRRLLDRWRSKVSVDEEKRAMGLLERFGIDVYTAGENLPRRFWLGAREDDRKVDYESEGGARLDPSLDPSLDHAVVGGRQVT